MDLSTKYLNLKLRNPVIVSASTLTSKLENIKKIAENGAGAIVLRSLFEEQITDEINSKMEPEDMYFWYPEAADFVKDISKNQGAKPYLTLIEESRKHIDIPVIASINCITSSEWTSFARQIENAGANAIELNISTLMPDKENIDCHTVTEYAISILEAVKREVSIPVSVKINPVPSMQVALTIKLEKSGADGMVLFNRPYRPDININDLSVVTSNYLSSREEMAESLRWIGILSQKTNIDLAASTGIHNHEDVIKQLLAGANATQICTTLYKNGIAYISDIINGLEKWMESHQFMSIEVFRGKAIQNQLSAIKFERVQFLEKNFKE